MKGGVVKINKNLSEKAADIPIVLGKETIVRMEWDGLSGCLYIYTKQQTTYSTKLNYEVIPVFEVLDHRIGSCRVYTKAEKIKVTQGKASALIEAQGNVLYEERNNELILTFNALLDKKYPMKVSKITLLNYTNDLGILGQDF